MLKINKLLKYLITFKFIKILSYNSARFLQLKLNESHKQKYLYYYGFQILYGAINKGLLLLLVGLLFHILPKILVVALSFMSLRLFIGGLHFDSYTKCAWVSLLTLVLTSLISANTTYNPIINFLVFSTLLVIAIKYAPVEHKNRILTDREKIKFKYIAMGLTIILFILQLVIKNEIINNSIMYGVLLAGIIALPIFHNVE
jgi:accessory gene regulator B